MMETKLYLKPETIAEAVELAHAHKSSFRYLAGGTDVLVNKFQENESSGCLIDITNIKELKEISATGNLLKIGALVKLEELQHNNLIQKHFPALLEAAHSVATPVLRRTATLGGNVLCENRCSFYNQSEWWRESVGYCLKCDGDLCIATGGRKACFSKFVSDTAPVLISLDAELEVIDKNGPLTIPLESIYTGDGIAPRNLPETTLIKFITLPLNREYKTIFKKLRPRAAVDFTSLTTAVTLNAEGKLKIVIGGSDPKPVVLKGSLNDDPELHIKKALKICRVVDNDYYSRNYRREMIGVFLEQSFEELKNLPPLQ